ncbi:MAG TPA: M1 family metallopeptidase [Thermoanaerobaculia bacterium]|nr:M1 family metallopeptidase [Thermoanaerobaculia bacterium]
MRARLILFTASSILVAGIGQASALPNWRLDPRVSPTMQEITLRLDPSAESYTGSTSIELAISETVGSFRLHAEEMDIRALTLTRGGTGIPVTFEERERAILEVIAAEPLAPGTATLQIDFANEYDKRAVGLYKMSSADYLFTQFEAVDARKAFPSWDEPEFKIPFQMTIEAPEGLTVITNTPEEASEIRDGWRRVRYAKTKPLPTYLLALAVGEFDRVPIEGMGVPGNIYAVRGRANLAGLAAREIPPLLAAHERWFGMPYPYEKLDFLAVPEYWPGAMEHPGLITFADRILLLDEARATLGQRRTLSNVISHEIAHQWFGNLVTMQWWDDLWLNESFADWLGDKIAADVHPEHQVGISELGSIQNIMAGDARPSAEPILAETVAPESVLNRVGLAYNKGKAVLGMFERWVGEFEFQKGVRAYLRDNAWKNATSNDLWNALAATGRKDLPEAMATFLEQPGFPLIEVTPVAEGEILLRQSRFTLPGNPGSDSLWKVPVAIRFASEGREGEKTVLLTGREQRVKLAGAPLDWIYPNADGTGYYRWTLPPDRILSLAERAQGTLTVRERITFVGNMAALLDGDVIEGDDFLRTLEQFALDAEPLVLGTVVSEIAGIESAFVTEDLEPAFAVWVRRTLRPALDRIGISARPGEEPAIAPIRAQLVGILATDGNDPQIRQWGRELAASYMKDPSSVDSSLASTALLIAALDGDEELFETFKGRFETTDNPADRQRFLRALSAFEGPEIVEEALAYSLTGPLRANELLSIAYGIREGAKGRERSYRWLIENWDTVSSRIPPLGLPGLASFAGGCEEERLTRAREFFADSARGTPPLLSRLERVEDQVQECVALRAREGAAVREYLQKGSGDS